jgi:hypothetical protein
MVSLFYSETKGAQQKSGYRLNSTSYLCTVSGSSSAELVAAAWACCKSSEPSNKFVISTGA